MRVATLYLEFIYLYVETPRYPESTIIRAMCVRTVTLAGRAGGHKACEWVVFICIQASKRCCLMKLEIAGVRINSLYMGTCD